MSQSAIEEAALSDTILYHGEEFLLCVDHVLVMGQQSSSIATFASAEKKSKKKKSTKKTYGTGVRGQIVVTNYRILFDGYNTKSGYDFIIPMASISSLTINKRNKLRSSLTVKQSSWCPTFQFKTQPHVDSFSVIVRHHSFLDEPFNPAERAAAKGKGADHTLFAFRYLHSTSNVGWHVYDPIQDYRRIGLLDESSDGSSAPFRVFDNNFQLSQTYPNVFLVPSTIDDATLRRAAEYRSRKRTVATVWMERETRVSLSRCAQPMRGLTNHTSSDDQRLVLAQRNATRGDAQDKLLWFVDARKALAAFGNKAKGKGAEDVQNYNGSELLHLNIENIHHMRRSLDDLTDVCEPLSVMAWEDDWFSKVDASLWLRHCRLVLGGSHEIVRLMQVERCCVVCHCSDGWDRTAQLCAMAELLMDPWYRTCEGLAVLIEKEWLSFGHKFHDRVGHGDATGYPGSQERSPIFVQWLDCVWQLINQFPVAFEFSEEFLLCIVDHHLSCCYGTFLFNSEWERMARDVASNTTSLWSDLLGRYEDKPELYNGKYSPENTDRVLYPSCSIRNLKVWKNLWLRRESPCV